MSDIEPDDELHAIPKQDTVAHEMSTDCICGPTAKPVEKDGKHYVIHAHHHLTEPNDG